MCLLIAGVLFFAAYNFFEQGYSLQAYVSILFGVTILIYFIYRVSKNAKCFFNINSKQECEKERKASKVAKKEK